MSSEFDEGSLHNPEKVNSYLSLTTYMICGLSVFLKGMNVQRVMEKVFRLVLGYRQFLRISHDDSSNLLNTILHYIPKLNIAHFGLLPCYRYRFISSVLVFVEVLVTASLHSMGNLLTLKPLLPTRLVHI